MTQHWPEAVPALISARFPLAAYRDLLLGGMQGIKNVLSLDASAQDVMAASAGPATPSDG